MPLATNTYIFRSQGQTWSEKEQPDLREECTESTMIGRGQVLRWCSSCRTQPLKVRSRTLGRGCGTWMRTPSELNREVVGSIWPLRDSSPLRRRLTAGTRGV